MWRSDGKELFYLELDGRVMTLSVTTGPTMEVGTTTALFQTNIRPGHLSQYAVSADGQRFLVLEPERTGGEPLTSCWTGRRGWSTDEG